MAAPIGNKNGKGRIKGSTNKNIAPLREKFHQLLDRYDVDMMAKDLTLIEPKERLLIMVGLAKYVIPKPNIKIVDDIDSDVEITLVR